MERLAASVGLAYEQGVAPRFSPMLDVSCGGVLLALPAILAIGLLRHTEKHFSLPKGYYGLSSIFLLLCFLALSRVKTVEKLRYETPGEWGKLLGLDRSPEARTLRDKINLLAEAGHPIPWSAELCREWMQESPLQAQVCYVDGHVRVYHGDQTRLPVDPGLVQVIEQDIVAVLERDVPLQPSQMELESNPLLHRFTVVFDREGYSPPLMLRLRQRRVACLTYRKKPGDDWPEVEFSNREVHLVCGELVTMRLAERGTFLGGLVWVREFRRLTDSGHQTAMVTTDYSGAMPVLAATMFARWSQENFFAYMRSHYGLDKLISYGTEEVPDTVKVVNPEYRRLDGELRKRRSRMNRVAAEFGSLGLEGEIAPLKVEAYERKKAGLQDETEVLSAEIEALKAERKTVERHITFKELPEEARFERLAINSKHFIDTIKMVAYRAETAMAQIMKEKMARHDDARALLQSIYSTEADFFPDEAAETLTVRLHNMASRSHDAAVGHLCDELNATETVYPGTNLRMVYELVSLRIP